MEKGTSEPHENGTGDVKIIDSQRTPTTQGKGKESPNGSILSRDSFEEHNVGDIDDAKKPNVDVSNLAKDASSNHSSFNEAAVMENPMFKQLCDPSNYRDAPKCHICQKDFGILRKKYTCKFCGNSVCEFDSPKRRKNPQKPEDFERICDKCENIYLKKMIFESYHHKRVEREAKIEKKMSDLNAQLQVYKNFMHDLEALKGEHKKANEEIGEGNKKLRDKNQKIRDEVEKIERDNANISEQIRILSDKTQDGKKRLEEREKVVEERKKTLEELSKTIQARSNDLVNIRNEISELERKIDFSASVLMRQSQMVTAEEGKPENTGDVNKSQASSKRRVNAKDYTPDGQENCQVCGIF